MDTKKHASLFTASRIEGSIAVVGLGALGSAVAIQLAKLGLTNLVLFDADTVEPHNLPNQILYGPEDIGELKVIAADRMIQRLTGAKSDTVSEMLTERGQLTGVSHVFVCVDSMAAREHIFRRCVFLNPNIATFIEGRVSARGCTMYNFDPRETMKARDYIDRLYPDSEAMPEVGTCGTVLMLGATAMSLACQMVWAFISRYEVAGIKIHAEELSYVVDDFAVEHKGMLAL